MENDKVYQETCTVMLPKKEQKSAFNEGKKLPQYATALTGKESKILIHVQRD
jgi:hypothetical protein